MAAELDVLIDAIRALGRDFAKEVAREAADDVLEAVKQTASAGAAPDGKAWKPRAADGGRALVKAADHITVKVLGTIIQLQLAYPYAIHNNLTGTASRVRRQILPDGSQPLPELVIAAITAAAARVLKRKTGQ